MTTALASTGVAPRLTLGHKRCEFNQITIESPVGSPYAAAARLAAGRGAGKSPR